MVFCGLAGIFVNGIDVVISAFQLMSEKAMIRGGIFILLWLGGWQCLFASSFPAELDLRNLDGSNGFVIQSNDSIDRLGISVSEAGDFNNDGLTDLIVGAYGDLGSKGRSYVIYGGSTVGSGGIFDVSTLNGTNGFVIDGHLRNYGMGYSVNHAGDINSDGIDDLFIGTYGTDPYCEFYGNSCSFPPLGRSYVLFGGSGIGANGNFNLTGLNGSNGFYTVGVTDAGRGYSHSYSGIGDLNADGVDDLAIGILAADPNGKNRAGSTYVLFGGSTVGSSGSVSLASLNGNSGFVINGVDINDRSGAAVSGLGDVNADGIDDLIIGAPRADTNEFNAGESYVVFGGASVGASGTLELSALSGNDGFVVTGFTFAEFAGRSVSGPGDINSDGINDIIIGSNGESFVLYGNATIGALGLIDLASLPEAEVLVEDQFGFRISNGNTVNAAGDVNNDGVADFILGTSETDPENTNATPSGDGFVVFGGKGLGSVATIDVELLDGSDGFAMRGQQIDDALGYSVSGLGDINNDGIDDLIVGAYGVSKSYVVFGKQTLCNSLAITVNLNLDQVTTMGDDVILGTPGRDVVRGKGGHDTICGMGGRDFIHGNSGDDWVDGGKGADNLRGGQGSDIIYTGTGATVGIGARVFGGYGDDLIVGGDDADDIKGGGGMDILRGGGGDDQINGNEGDDLLYGENGDDILKGGIGESDQLFGGLGNDSLNGGEGDSDQCDGGGDMGDSEVNCEIPAAI